MKGSIFAAAAMVGSALADGHLHRRHDALHQRRSESASSYTPSSYTPSSSAVVTPSSSVAALDAEQTCGCTTKVITVWGAPTLVPIQPTSTATPTPEEETTTLTSTVHSTSTKTQTVTVTPSVVATSSTTPSSAPLASPSTSTIYVSLPTAGVTSFSQTGIFTIPATTLTVTESTTVAGATTTEVPSGTHTIGEVTTVVETSTTVTCPYATVKPSGSVSTTTIETTTYVCPASGTYTVVPGTVTSVPSSTVIVYPTVQTISPGTYTQPQSVVTVTQTDYTYVCPFATGGASTSAVPTPPAVPVTSSVVPAISSTSEASQPSSTGGSGAGSGVTGKGQYGMTFSPYTESGDCMTLDEVKKNLQIINQKGFNLVRVYSTDCNSLDNIGSVAKELGMKMIIGVYIDYRGIKIAQEQVTEIVSWAQWSLVQLIVVGNEAISSGYAQPGEMANFITTSKAMFQKAGYTGEVTTTEPIDVWQQHGVATLCPVVDLVGANIHPFFNADTTAAEAGKFALSEYQLLEKICNKDVLNLETGWPNAGNANGAAIPGIAEQSAAVKGIAEAIGSKSIFFSYANDAWKAPGQFGVEPHWGCVSVF